MFLGKIISGSEEPRRTLPVPEPSGLLYGALIKQSIKCIGEHQNIVKMDWCSKILENLVSLSLLDRVGMLKLIISGGAYGTHKEL